MNFAAGSRGGKTKVRYVRAVLMDVVNYKRLYMFGVVVGGFC